MASSACYLGTDVGGTFTDFVFYTGNGAIRCIKVPSTPPHPGQSILAGVDELGDTLASAEAGWRRMVHTHSSTVATNALIERRGARIGLLVSSGFRDLFELQRLALPHPMRFTSRRPQPLVPRALVREIGGRIAADGSEIEPLVTEDVLKAARELAALEIEIAVVALLHSYRNPAHEESVRRIAEESGLGLRVELSSEAWPQAREYERGVLTAINASIRPVIEGYVDRLTRGLVNESGRSAAANGATSFARRRYCSVAIDPTDVRRASEERLRARCHPQLEGWRNGNSLGSRQRRRRPRCRVARNSKFGSLAMHSRYCDRRRRINPPSVPLVRLKARHRSPAFPISPGLIQISYFAGTNRGPNSIQIRTSANRIMKSPNYPSAAIREAWEKVGKLRWDGRTHGRGLGLLIVDALMAQGTLILGRLKSPAQSFEFWRDQNKIRGRFVGVGNGVVVARLNKDGLPE